MNDDDHERPAGDGTNRTHAGTSETLLRAEIKFWRELLSESDGSLPAESIERMRQALALAEQRFLRLFGEHSTGQRSSSGPAWTSPPGPRFLH
jgi:hypothetical protein